MESDWGFKKPASKENGYLSIGQLSVSHKALHSSLTMVAFKNTDPQGGKCPSRLKYSTLLLSWMG